MKDPLELIDIKTIKKEGIVPYNEETIRRYFRRGVFHVHRRKAEDGTTILSYRGSVEIRFNTFEKIARQDKQKRLSIEETGAIIKQVSGEEDNFIVGRMKKNILLKKITTEFIEKVKEKIKK